jgi:hypothetical protein
MISGNMAKNFTVYKFITIPFKNFYLSFLYMDTDNFSYFVSHHQGTVMFIYIIIQIFVDLTNETERERERERERLQRESR